MPRLLLLALVLCTCGAASAQTLSTLIVPPEGAAAAELSAAQLDSVAAIEVRVAIARDRGQDATADSLRDVLRALVPPPVLPYARVFADGNVRSGVTGAASAGSSTGSLGVQVQTRAFGRLADAAFRISVIGQADSVTSDFGAALLAPASGSTLNAGIADVRFIDVLGGLDVRAYGSVSTSNWSVPTDSTSPGGGPGRRPIDAGVLGAGLLLSEAFVSGLFPGGAPVAVVGDFGVAVRTVIGDLGTASNTPFRVALFGGDQRAFVGVEAGLGIQVGGVKAGLTYYYFDEDVAGFGNGQVVAGIGIETALIQGVLTRL